VYGRAALMLSFDDLFWSARAFVSDGVC